VVVSTAGGAPETAVNGKTGIFADPCDIEANAQAVAKILENDVFADELGRNGREYALKCFNENVFKANIVKFIELDNRNR
jgi:glycosyltransferase involved in cell wall biosynthesis